jgi:hypothetical protein
MTAADPTQEGDAAVAVRENIAAGTLGLLVGCMLGFSAQSEIAGTVAGILTLATGLLGVAKPSFLAPSSGDDPNTRMIWFGGTATAAFLLTYLLAINHALEPSAKDRVRDLVRAGYDEPVAKALIARKEYEVDVDVFQRLVGKPLPAPAGAPDPAPGSKDGDRQP